MEDLLEKIKKIERLISGAMTDGERIAAIAAKERVLKKFEDVTPLIHTKEYALHTPGAWNKKLLLALCHKHGVRPYRYKRQKHTTVMVNMNEKYLNEVLWPEYLEYSGILSKFLEEVTDDLIAKIHKHVDEDLVQELT